MVGVYTACMRWQTVIVLAAIIVGTVAPVSLQLAVPKDGNPEIGILNVCHSATPALSSNGDMPCMSGCPYIQAPASSVTSGERPNSVLIEMLSPQVNERPPET